MTLYGLRFKTVPNKYISVGDLVGITSYSNLEGDFCVSTGFELDAHGDSVWIVKEKAQAEYAMVNSTPWFNADYETPENPYVGHLEIYEVEVK